METTSFEEIKEILKVNALEMAEYRKNREEAELELRAKFKQTDEQISALGKQLGGIGNSNGYFAEQFFVQSLKNKKSLGGINFDEIETNLKHKRKGLTDESDIVLYNGDCIGIVEVKYVADKADLRILLEKKASNFRYLYPEYADYKIYLGLAGLSFDSDQVKEDGIAAGVVILEAIGNHTEISADNMKAF